VTEDKVTLTRRRTELVARWAALAASAKDIHS
jgi:hypothetical protein